MKRHMHNPIWKSTVSGLAGHPVPAMLHNLVPIGALEHVPREVELFRRFLVHGDIDPGDLARASVRPGRGIHLESPGVEEAVPLGGLLLTGHVRVRIGVLQQVNDLNGSGGDKKRNGIDKTPTIL